MSLWPFIQTDVNVITHILTCFPLRLAMTKHHRFYSAYAQHTRNNLKRATKLYGSTVIGQETFSHVLKLDEKGRSGRIGSGSARFVILE
jgi:hypothetical protein